MTPLNQLPKLTTAVLVCLLFVSSAYCKPASPIDSFGLVCSDRGDISVGGKPGGSYAVCRTKCSTQNGGGIAFDPRGGTLSCIGTVVCPPGYVMPVPIQFPLDPGTGCSLVGPSPRPIESPPEGTCQWLSPPPYPQLVGQKPQLCVGEAICNFYQDGEPTTTTPPVFCAPRTGADGKPYCPKGLDYCLKDKSVVPTPRTVTATPKEAVAEY